ncbi:hypothetical protein D9V37_08200 [Nocardioides mangrovicus]|uniref:Uncharacterized protein n=1 Tax=Nocardioides mangrovicus TaxID=2478913 RepID=A0A3L8P5F0_9ACTN|nr:hypothetical protein [Nocardioides mangrovicus]RLV49859.1 hypothetical protein D9V37_08200 [Nocardioides mangrovicus]
MLTDDEITTRLRRSFEHATADLHYARPVAPPRPRPALVLVPAVSLAGAAAMGVVVAGQPGAAPSPHSPGTHAAPPSPTVVTTSLGTPSSTIRFAGYLMTSPAGVDAAHAVAALVTDPVPVPTDASRVRNADGVEAAVGHYPGTDREAIWVTVPSRNDGRPMALVSPDLTRQQLLELWRTGTSATK